MKEVFGDDARRISHALAVLEYAVRICEEEFPGDSRLKETVELAALLHDIGIKEAEARFGSTAPVHQHREGPPIARRILEEAGAGKDTVDRVCHIVGSHHFKSKIDGNDFLALWEADLLVNLPGFPISGAGYDRYRKMVMHNFRTGTGRRMALEMYPQKKTHE